MDGLLVKINYDFLQLLAKNNLVASQIKLKYLKRDIPLNSIKFERIEDFQAYINKFNQILKDRSYLCYAGEFVVIENLNITCTSLNYTNEFRRYIITEKRSLIKKIRLDNTIDNSSTTDRYEKIQSSFFDDYVTTVNNAIFTRLNSYTDPCYVDAGYVDPNV